MLGRGIPSDTFLPARIKGLEYPADPQAYIRHFVNDLFSAYREERDDSPSVLNAMKEYRIYLSESFDEPVRVFRKLRKAKYMKDFEVAIARVFDGHKFIGSGI